jgi:6-pyruvoyltetrahydropterin/6-carboxytetrahydropterin synthase
MITCTKRLEWDAAHRVLRHESKCGSLHGHRYSAEIKVSADQLDHVGRVVDFGCIKEKVGGWIDASLDHTTIVYTLDKSLLQWCINEHENLGKHEPFIMKEESTAENLAKIILAKARDLLNTDGIFVVSVRVYETPTCWAEAT